MGKFLRTLAKVGLVELDEPEERPAEPEAAAPPADQVDMAELDRIIASAGGGAEAPAQAGASWQTGAPPPGSSAQAGAGSAAIREGRSFDEIYTMASVATSSFPAEKMLRVLDGLKAMDPATRKAAVMAMDLADDEWSVEDSVLDAQRKMRALQSAAAALAERLSQEATRVAAELQARESYQQQATESIRKQIAELEVLLQQEIQKVAEEKSAIEAGLRAAREACERETARYRQELSRLQEILVIFAASGSPAPR